MNGRLYHGTAAKWLPQIEAKGLRPRSASKNKGNWAHTIQSNRDAVYLTDAYAWHFAGAASGQEPGLIVEVDRSLLRPWKLCPDEDFLEQGSRKLAPGADNPNFAPTDWPMRKRVRFYRELARHNPRLADDSLKYLGTAAYYGDIPWSAVTRYVSIDWKNIAPEMHLRARDSLVSVLNYRILQDRHRAFTRWFFGDPVTAPELTGYDGELPDSFVRMNAVMAEVMQNRAGLQVVDVKPSGSGKLDLLYQGAEGGSDASENRQKGPR